MLDIYDVLCFLRMEDGKHLAKFRLSTNSWRLKVGHVEKVEQGGYQKTLN